MEIVKANINVLDNILQIIPENEMQDNSIYEVKINGLKAKNGTNINNAIVKFATAMSPAYCSLIDVESLMDIIDIPKDIILYNIREASRYADYIYITCNPGLKIKKDKIPFAIKEFTRYKAARDCLLKIYMGLVSNNIVQGQLGEVKFQTRPTLPDIKNLLNYLDKEISKWTDAIKGYDLEGRARMKTAIRGHKHKEPNPSLVRIGLNRGVY